MYRGQRVWREIETERERVGDREKERKENYQKMSWELQESLVCGEEVIWTGFCCEELSWGGRQYCNIALHSQSNFRSSCILCACVCVFVCECACACPRFHIYTFCNVKKQIISRCTIQFKVHFQNDHV